MRQLFVFVLFILSVAYTQEKTFTNPIIPGAYPDPSICRVGDDFYIVNSSFEYFPGLPIHRSKDLVNWELVGYGLHREEQCNGEMNLVDVQSDGGIHAPSIRYHDGLFYIITTNVYAPRDGSHAKMVNFIITAEKIEGPWSQPHIIEGAPGIDPDIFFDDDGKVYFVGTHAVGQPDVNGIGELWVQELDIQEWKLKGERHSLWRGACGGCCLEGPHIYKVHDKYYLMAAEGGTSYNHAVVIAASDEISGPYESNPRNPIMTSRHLSKTNWVHSTGHADLVELEDGRWYMVALGKRSDLNGSSNMGRETHLMPVIWEPAIIRWVQVSEDRWEPLEYMWPVVAPQTGRVERKTPLPFVDKPQVKDKLFKDSFEDQDLDLQWNFRRVPKPGTYSLEAREGHLRLYARPEVIAERESASLMGVRQAESDFEFVAKMNFKPEKRGVEAGLSLFQKDNNYFTFTVQKKLGKNVVKLELAERQKEITQLESVKLRSYKGDILLKVVSEDDTYTFAYSLDDGASYTTLKQMPADKILSNGYTGAYVGLYSSGNGKKTGDFADFDWMQYQGFQKN
jgi:xylan 1,4-beta-xylosidase